MRAELTARDVAAQQRSLAARQRELAAIERARDAAAQRALRARLTESAPGLMAEMDAARLGQRRLRRSRAVTSLTTLLALIGIGVAVSLSAWAWAGFAAFVAISGGMLLTGLARAQRRRTAPVAGVAAPEFVDLAPPVRRAPAGARREWTPVPLPKPSYLSAPVVPAGAVAPALDHAAALAAAAAEAERAQRAALAAASVDRTTAPSTATDGEARASTAPPRAVSPAWDSSTACRRARPTSTRCCNAVARPANAASPRSSASRANGNVVDAPRAVAQLVARLVRIEEVRGSNPLRSPNTPLSSARFR